MANRRRIGQSTWAGALEGAATSLQGNLRTELAHKRELEKQALERAFDFEKQSRQFAHNTSERESELVPVEVSGIDPITGAPTTKTSYEVRAKAAGSKVGPTTAQAAAAARAQRPDAKEIGENEGARQAAAEPFDVSKGLRTQELAKQMKAYEQGLLKDQPITPYQRRQLGNEDTRIGQDNSRIGLERERVDMLKEAARELPPGMDKIARDMIDDRMKAESVGGTFPWSDSTPPTFERQQQIVREVVDGLKRKVGTAPGPTPKPTPDATQKPMTATNPQTGEMVISLDGGKTWNPTTK